ncbi:MAG: HK97 family phage prohead protease [Muribaculaceae bacterium]|nr:HK97 family phage prohead protease [Muribaculaceae bacterium]
MSEKKDIRRELVTLSADLRVRQAGESEAPGRVITGRAIVFDTPSAIFYEDEECEIREIIDKGAITRELLDSSDIKFLLFHDRQLLLARSRNGEGTLKYDIDDSGVTFEFEAPATADGDKALELVRRGDIAGCSFAFTTRYWDSQYVEVSRTRENGKTKIINRVKVITGIYDMSLVSDPAYPATSTEARELIRQYDRPSSSHVDEMKATANKPLSL